MLDERNTFVISNFPFRYTLEDSEGAAIVSRKLLPRQNGDRLFTWILVYPIAANLLVHQKRLNRVSICFRSEFTAVRV